MTLVFTLDPDPTPGLRAEIVALWTDVSNAGGAVGFVPPVTAEQVQPTAEEQFAGLGPAGPDRLLIGREAGTGRLAAALFFASMRFDLMEHWRVLKRIMVHPDLQGRGHGAELLAEAERTARAWGLDSLRLTLRGGLGLEKFYGRCGWTEVGRVPRAIRVGPGDDRDDVTMWLDLRDDIA
ncbi:GNAT family N-acetyltransferase [Kitasatospora sp. NPDC085879]|uniref:GNAT family N-acetyltransferase n=1 Tax=Kitasatospora sp. NPDC085879 TaxID=3154769 RepID=UPI00342884AD